MAAVLARFALVAALLAATACVASNPSHPWPGCRGPGAWGLAICDLSDERAPVRRIR